MANEVKIKKIEDSQVEINVKVEDAEFKKYKEKSLAELGKNVKIKGFRPGHVPRDVLEKHVSKEGILGLAIDMALDASYRDAIIEHKVGVMSRPSVKIESEDPLEYTVTVAVKPDAKVKNYKKIKVKIKEQKATKKEIEKTVQDLLKGKAAWHDVNRKAKS